MAGMGHLIDKLHYSVGLQTKDMDKGAKRAEGTLKKVGAGINKFKGIIVAAVGAMAVKFAISIARMAGEAEGLERSFRLLSASYGANADSMLADLKRISHGTMATVNIIKQANQAMLLGIPVTAIGRLMEIAMAASKTTGQSVQFMFESITLGIGRQSRLILDNLGIIVKQEEIYRKASQKLGRELTETEKKQEFLNAVLKSGARIIKTSGGESLTAAQRMQRLSAATENAKVALGKVLASPVAKFFEILASTVQNAAESLEQLKETDLERTVRQMRELGMSAKEISEYEIAAKLEAAQKRLEELRDVELTPEITVQRAVGKSRWREIIVKPAEWLGLPHAGDINELEAKYVKSMREMIKWIEKQRKEEKGTEAILLRINELTTARQKGLSVLGDMQRGVTEATKEEQEDQRLLVQSLEERIEYLNDILNNMTEIESVEKRIATLRAGKALPGAPTPKPEKPIIPVDKAELDAALQEITELYQKATLDQYEFDIKQAEKRQELIVGLLEEAHEQEMISDEEFAQKKAELAEATEKEITQINKDALEEQLGNQRAFTQAIEALMLDRYEQERLKIRQQIEEWEEQEIKFAEIEGKKITIAEWRAAAIADIDRREREETENTEEEKRSQSRETWRFLVDIGKMEFKDYQKKLQNQLALLKKQGKDKTKEYQRIQKELEDIALSPIVHKIKLLFQGDTSEVKSAADLATVAFGSLTRELAKTSPAAGEFMESLEAIVRGFESGGVWGAMAGGITSLMDNIVDWLGLGEDSAKKVALEHERAAEYAEKTARTIESLTKDIETMTLGEMKTLEGALEKAIGHIGLGERRRPSEGALLTEKEIRLLREAGFEVTKEGQLVVPEEPITLRTRMPGIEGGRQINVTEQNLMELLEILRGNLQRLASPATWDVSTFEGALAKLQHDLGLFGDLLTVDVRDNMFEFLKYFGLFGDAVDENTTFLRGASAEYMQLLLAAENFGIQIDQATGQVLGLAEGAQLTEAQLWDFERRIDAARRALMEQEKATIERRIKTEGLAGTEAADLWRRFLWRWTTAAGETSEEGWRAMGEELAENLSEMLRIQDLIDEFEKGTIQAAESGSQAYQATTRITESQANLMNAVLNTISTVLRGGISEKLAGILRENLKQTALLGVGLKGVIPEIPVQAAGGNNFYINVDGTIDPALAEQLGRDIGESVDNLLRARGM